MKATVKKIEHILDRADFLKEKDSKFDHAVLRLTNRSRIGFEKFNESIEDARIDLCSIDDKNNVIRDDKNGYVFSRDNLKALTKKNIQLRLVEFDIEPYYATSFPKELTEDDIELFIGYLIDPQNIPQISTDANRLE